DCRGSAAQPYRAAVDLDEPAFRCTCPSRKLPCKHALALLLLAAADEAALPPGDLPPGVAEWLARRGERARRSERGAAAPADPERLREAAARRVDQRLSRMEHGVAEIGLWLEDLVRAGLRELPGRPTA